MKLIWGFVTTICLLSLSALTNADGWQLVDLGEEASYQSKPQEGSSKYLAELKLHTVEEITALLDRAESYHQENGDTDPTPIQLVLHGGEAHFFRKKNYEQYKNIVDKAAKLDAFNVVDVKVCETWMRFNDTNKSEFPAFIDTVPLGTAEKSRLMKEGYTYF